MGNGSHLKCINVGLKWTFHVESTLQNRKWLFFKDVRKWNVYPFIIDGSSIFFSFMNRREHSVVKMVVEGVKVAMLFDSYLFQNNFLCLGGKCWKIVFIACESLIIDELHWLNKLYRSTWLVMFFVFFKKYKKTKSGLIRWSNELIERVSL